MSFSTGDILKAANLGNVNLATEVPEGRWCSILRELVGFLDALASNVPWYKSWQKPGLRLAAYALDQLRGLKCK